MSHNLRVHLEPKAIVRAERAHHQSAVRYNPLLCSAPALSDPLGAVLLKEYQFRVVLE